MLSNQQELEKLIKHFSEKNLINFLKNKIKDLTGESTAQHSTAQHSTAQHSTAQHSTAQHSTAQHSTAIQFSSVLLIN